MSHQALKKSPLSKDSWWGKKEKSLGLAGLRKQEFLSLSLAALDSHSLVIGHLLTVAITQDGY